MFNLVLRTSVNQSLHSKDGSGWPTACCLAVGRAEPDAALLPPHGLKAATARRERGRGRGRQDEDENEAEKCVYYVHA